MKPFYQDEVYIKMCSKAIEIQKHIARWYTMFYPSTFYVYAGIYNMDGQKEAWTAIHPIDFMIETFPGLAKKHNLYKETLFLAANDFANTYIVYSLLQGRTQRGENPGTHFFTKFIWLPRQDQLQEISGLHWIEFDKKCAEIITYHKGKFLNGNEEEIPWSEVDFNSMAIRSEIKESKEQAGLKVVIETLYNKKWSGEDWV